MAEILIVNRAELPEEWLDKEGALSLCYEEFAEVVEKIKVHWKERSEAEEDKSFKQLIPYAVAFWDEKIGCYKRSGDEKRLHDQFSIGAGGHIDREDDKGKILDTLENGLARELAEEFADFDDNKGSVEFVGVINDDNSPVGSVHLGIVFKINLNEKLFPGEELTGFEWVEKEMLEKRNLEKWSQLALKIL